MRMATRLAARIGWTLLALGVLSVLIFIAMNYKSPEEIARAAVGRTATHGQLVTYATAHGLYDPLPTRYLSWLGHALTGDLGVSPITNRPVARVILPELARTLTLAGLGVLIGIPSSIVLGTFMARRKGSRSDVGFLMASVALAATPEFVIGLGLLMIFGVWLGWLPIESGSAFAFGTGTQQIVAYVLPALTVAVAIIPHMYRFVRTAVHEGLQAPFVEAARLRGLPSRTIHWDFVMRNSAAPIINAAAFDIVFAVSGLVAIETVTSFPGIGDHLVQAIAQGDAITVQAIALILATVILVVFLLADLLTLALNPRLRLSR